MSSFFILTGLAGSGKSTVSSVFLRNDYFLFSMGDITRRSLENSKVIVNESSEKKFREKVREIFGNGFYAYTTISILKRANNNIVIDGLRTEEELRIFKNIFPFLKLIFVKLNKNDRLKRLMKRSRRNYSYIEAGERDSHEIKFFHTEKLENLSDYVINNNKAKNYLKNKVESIIKK